MTERDIPQPEGDVCRNLSMVHSDVNGAHRFILAAAVATGCGAPYVRSEPVVSSRPLPSDSVTRNVVIEPVNVGLAILVIENVERPTAN